MGRLREETLERIMQFSDRVLHVCEALDSQGRSRRFTDQLTGSGCSVGANTFEADEAMSRADFCKTLSIVIKEINETRFWLGLAVRRKWLPANKVEPLIAEAVELKRMFGAMVSRTRAKSVA